MIAPPESLQEKIQRVLRDEIVLVPCDPAWPGRFAEEAALLRRLFPEDLTGRIEHFGSTSVPGLTAKPVIDMLVEVEPERARCHIAPLLEARGYDYFWRPIAGDGPDGPHYAWFIKRDAHGIRTHHIHMVESASPLWEGLIFRDILRSRPDTAAAYAALKIRLSEEFRGDRIAYTHGKTDFIRLVIRFSFQTRCWPLG